MGAQFEEYRHALAGLQTDRRAEQHGLPQVARPVTGTERLALGAAPQHGRIDRHADRPWNQSVQRQCEFRRQRLHLRTVRCDIDLDQATEHIVFLQSGQDRADRVGRTGDHAGSRTVACRHRHAILQPGEPAAELSHREIDERHCALATDPPHQSAACANHLHGLIEIERAGDTGGGHLTHAVPDDRIGFDPDRPQ